MSTEGDATNDTRVKLRLRGLDYDSVLNWTARPKRTRRTPPPTYWEEFVETDEWYLRELVSDVPAEELHAALEDENWEHDNSDAIDEGGEDDDGGDDSVSGEGSGEESDSTFVPSDADDDEHSTTSTDDTATTTPGSDDDDTQHDPLRNTLHFAVHFSDDDDGS